MIALGQQKGESNAIQQGSRWADCERRPLCRLRWGFPWRYVPGRRAYRLPQLPRGSVGGGVGSLRAVRPP